MGYDDLSNIRSGIFFFVFVFFMQNSAANMEIELQSLIANKMRECLAIIMKVTFHRKKIAVVSQPKNSKFCD